MRPPATCVKRGSAKVTPDLLVRDVGERNAYHTLSVMADQNPAACIFKETFEDELRAAVFGHAELYVTRPGELYAAYERSKRPGG